MKEVSPAPPYSARVDGLAGYEQMVTALTGDAEWDALVVKGDAAYMDKLNGAKDSSWKANRTAASRCASPDNARALGRIDHVRDDVTIAPRAIAASRGSPPATSQAPHSRRLAVKS